MNTKFDRLTQITDYWSHRILIAVLFSAFILSYAALLTLAIEAGYSPWLAWLWPLLLDGVVIFSTMSLVKRQFAGQPTAYVWFLLIASDGLSIALNGYAAWPNVTYMAIHAAPPLVLVLLLKAYTNDAKDDARQAEAAANLAELRAEAQGQAAKLADLSAKIATAESRLVALKDESRQARIAANGEKGLLKNGNAAAPIEAANEAKAAQIAARRAKIEALLQGDPNLSQAELARRLNVSADTIRRDLAALEPDGPEVVDVLRFVKAELATNGNGGGHG